MAPGATDCKLKFSLAIANALTCHQALYRPSAKRKASMAVVNHSSLYLQMAEANDF